MPRKRLRLAELPTRSPTIMLPGWQKKLGKRLPSVEFRKPITKEDWDAARGEGSMLLRHELAGQIDRKKLFEKYPEQANAALKRFGGNRAKALTFLWLNSSEGGQKALEECRGDVNRASALLQIRENNVTRASLSKSMLDDALKRYPDPLKAVDYLRLQNSLENWRLDVKLRLSSYPGTMEKEEGEKYVQARKRVAEQIIGDLEERISRYKDPERALLVFNEINEVWNEDPENSKSQMNKAEADIRGLSSARLKDRQLRRYLRREAATYGSTEKARYGPYAESLRRQFPGEFRLALKSAPSRLTGRALLRQLRKGHRKRLTSKA